VSRPAPNSVLSADPQKDNFHNLIFNIDKNLASDISRAYLPRIVIVHSIKLNPLHEAGGKLRVFNTVTSEPPKDKPE